MTNLQKIIFASFFIFHPALEAQDSAYIQGGHVADTNEWSTGYFGTIYTVDGVRAERPCCTTQKQMVKVAPGKHKLYIGCEFEVEPKTFLSGEKVIEAELVAGITYTVEAKINFKRRRPSDPMFRYCEPLLIDPQANNSFKADAPGGARP